MSMPLNGVIWPKYPKVQGRSSAAPSTPKPRARSGAFLRPVAAAQPVLDHHELLPWQAPRDHAFGKEVAGRDVAHRGQQRGLQQLLAHGELLAAVFGESRWRRPQAGRGHLAQPARRAGDHLAVIARRSPGIRGR